MLNDPGEIDTSYCRKAWALIQDKLLDECHIVPVNDLRPHRWVNGAGSRA
jgi:hypothetical protein